jgi:3',5'-cyclic AMP phosphodiesterase CpdA
MLVYQGTFTEMLKSYIKLYFADQPFDWAGKQSNDELCATGSERCSPDYMLLSEIMRQSNRCHESSKVFVSLEKHHKFCGTGATLHHRRLLYDLVLEILNRHRYLSSWEAFKRARSASSAGMVQLPDTGNVWQQIQQMREPIISNEVMDVTSSAISKDMAADHTWFHQSVEVSDAVLQIEQMIFRDLIAGSIQELSDVASVSFHLPRRKLVF